MDGFEKRTQEKKQQVLDATFKLLNTSEGAEDVTMEEIAKCSNVGKTTIFKYFDSKDNLFKAVYTDFLSKLASSAEKIIEQNLSFEETMIALSQNKINALEKIDKQFYNDMMHFYTEKKDHGLTLLMKTYQENSVTMLLDLFHRGRKEGKVDLKYSDEFLLLYFQALVQGISSPDVYERIVPYTQEWTELLIKGLAPAQKK
ncbi:TetR/AcrR family transcriptional regulator [Companilactobacillus insicii]|uniref:TetR/AcrR family transcriptional regulator n=1 Tax=Companilactobacillus insicii TaxID=1732567 RepID=UPI000F7A1A57|nr:TetR/AcrR family transcriptional regulator [Companilactobacillus insicii]